MKSVIFFITSLLLFFSFAVNAATNEVECVSMKTRTSFTLTIVDVGDQTGLVVVTDTNMETKSYKEAYYDSLDGGGQFFVFGFDDFAAHRTPALHAIKIMPVTEKSGWYTGEVDYNATKEPVACLAK